MAQTGYDRPTGDAAPKTLSAEKVRQGQNVKGMIWVLIISLVLVVGAYAVMLALQAKPVGVDGRAADDPAAITAPSETAQSPG